MNTRNHSKSLPELISLATNTASLHKPKYIGRYFFFVGKQQRNGSRRSALHIYHLATKDSSLIAALVLIDNTGDFIAVIK